MNLKELLIKGKQQPTFVACLILSIVLIAAIYMRGGEFSKAEERLNEVTREGTRIDDNIKNSVNLNSHLDSLRGISQDIKSRLIRPSELARNLQYFYRLESETGVAIASLNQRSLPPRDKDENDDNTYVPVGYEIAVQGDYADLLAFMHAIENGVHFARINSFEAIRSQRQDDATMMSLSLNLELLGQR